MPGIPAPQFTATAISTPWQATLVCPGCAQPTGLVELWTDPLSGELAGRLPGGTPVTVLETRPTGEEAYYSVRAGRQSGWVAARFIQPPDASSPPASDPPVQHGWGTRLPGASQAVPAPPATAAPTTGPALAPTAAAPTPRPSVTPRPVRPTSPYPVIPSPTSGGGKG